VHKENPRDLKLTILKTSKNTNFLQELRKHVSKSYTGSTQTKRLV
jgi:hypothetical protein